MVNKDHRASLNRKKKVCKTLRGGDNKYISHISSYIYISSIYTTKKTAAKSRAASAAAAASSGIK